MNQYCNKLNFPLPTIDLTPYTSDHRTHVRVARDILGKEIDDLLASVDLKIQWVEAFYLGPGADHTVHCDGHELDTKAKMNFVVGGKGSVMTWYSCKDESKIEQRTSKANTIYLGTGIDNVVEEYSVEMDGFYLVNVGMFHNVWNRDEGRYCMSTCLVDLHTGYRINFYELQKRLGTFINE